MSTEPLHTDSDTLEQLEQPFLALRRQFDAVVEPHRPSLWRYCLRLTGSAWDAEDLAQDALLKAFAQLQMVARARDPRAYLLRMASNLWIDTIRRAKPRADLDEAADVPVASADPWPVAAAMDAIVSSLPPRQRVVFLLIDGFEFQAGEVAVMLRISEGAVKAMLHRARAALRARTELGTPAHDAQTTGARRAHRVLVDRYVEALNRRDPEALVTLFDPVAVNELVGGGELTGVDKLRVTFARWGADPRSPWTEAGVVDGRDVVLVFVPRGTDPKTLTGIVDLLTEGDRIIAQRWFHFSPELLEHVAATLGVPADAHGHGM